MAAHANGRMPGANDLVFTPGEPARIVARATFGLVQSADRGATWSWICEQAIDISGVIADPPIAVSMDGTLTLLPPTGSALVSADRGCNWTRAGAPLAEKRGADLTVDPSDPKRLLVITSTLRTIDATGFGMYENLVVETRDDARTWQLLATLPTDFEAETIEVAHSDPRRIYVSGSDARDPRLGIMLRSEDGGVTWIKTTLALPAGTGSMLISGIHRTDPDRVWVRVAARGDTLGLLPARLYLSSNKGEQFVQLAATTKGMFGFALSPDGRELAYGGPSDGLHVGPSDGSAPFVKRSSLGVRCLRWPEDGALYVCASEPADPFSVGVSSDRGVSFRGLYSLRDTCPAECATGSSFAGSCQSAWTETRPFIMATAAMCTVPWSAPSASDAGTSVVDAATPPVRSPLDAARPALPVVDAARDVVDASVPAPTPREDSGCAVRGGTGAGSWGWLGAVLSGLALSLRRRTSNVRSPS